MCIDVIEKTEFSIKELSDSAKQCAHQDWLENALSYDWWDSTYEEWTEKLKEKGINIENIYFSGFWLQGDGACFTGSVAAGPFIKAHATEENKWTSKYYVLLEAWEDSGTGNFALRHSGHYYHCYCVTNSDINDCNYAPSKGIFSQMEDEEFAALVNKQLDEFETDAMDICRGYMNDIYRALEEEYEHQTSMESFMESCEANEWLFDEDGDQI